MITLKGVSAIDQLFDGLRATHSSVELIELDRQINDVEFAEVAAGKLLALLRQE